MIVISVILVVIALYFMVKALLLINRTDKVTVEIADYYIYRSLLLLLLAVFMLTLADYILR